MSSLEKPGGTGKSSTPEDIRKDFGVLKEEVEKKKKAKEQKLKDVVKEAADLAEGNQKLQKAMLRTEPKGYRDIEEPTRAKRKKAQDGMKKIMDEGANSRAEISTLRKELENDLASASPGEQSDIRTLLARLVETEKEGNKTRELAHEAFKGDFDAHDSELDRITQVHNGFIRQQEDAAKDPEVFATRAVLDAHAELGEGDTGIPAIEVQRKVKDELGARESRERARGIVAKGKEGIQEAQTILRSFLSELEGIETQLPEALTKLQGVVDNPERAKQIQALEEIIQIGKNPGWFFRDTKQADAINARAKLKQIKGIVDKEFEQQYSAVTALNQKGIDIRRRIEFAGTDARFKDGGQDLGSALLKTHEASATGELFEITRLKADDPIRQQLGQEHTNNQTEYAKMKQLSKQILEKAQVLNLNINKSTQSANEAKSVFTQKLESLYLGY